MTIEQQPASPPANLKHVDYKNKVNEIIVEVNNATVFSIDELSNVDAKSKEDYKVFLSSGGRSGNFIWSNSDLSSEVAADHSQGVYIAPSFDLTGASGAWERFFLDHVHVDWFGAIGDYDPDLDLGTDDSIAFQSWLNSPYKSLSHSGDKNYKVTQELLAVNKLIKGYGSTVYQRDITKSLFNLNNSSGCEWYGGSYSHNMNIGDYDINNGRLFFSDVSVSDITLYQCRIFKTAQQGFDIDNGGSFISVLMCEFEETARDGVFLVDVTDAKVSLCTFKNTGDDSIAFAKDSYRHICTNNTIEGAGSYNLGGSGIRSNSDGVISNNTILNSDLFGIICASNSTDVNINPNGLKVMGNTIEGINKTGTVTAGIGFKECTKVTCTDNSIKMPLKEAHAYRIYGTDKKTESININGGKIENALSLIFIRDDGVEDLLFNDVEYKDCTNSVFIEATGAVDNLEMKNCKSENTTNASYLRISTSNTATVGEILTENNRIKTPNDSNFDYGNLAFTAHTSRNDQYPTGVYADYKNTALAGVRVLDGRYGDVTVSNGEITFNAINSGLIPMSLSSNITPLVSELSVINTAGLGLANNWYVDFIDSVNFRITLNTEPSQDITFNYKVNAYDNRLIN